MNFDALTAFEVGEQKIGRSQDRGRNRQRRARIGHGENHVHVENLRRAEMEEPGQRALLTARTQPVPARL